MKTVDLIVGARPNFVKIAALIKAYGSNQVSGCNFRFRVVHTGQHYDHTMSGGFFEQLGIGAPDINFEVGSGTHAEQTAKIMMQYDALLQKKYSDICVVVGDVNSTLACALVAKKRNIVLAHVEAGIRSNDRTMPEEINRLATDAITDLFFTTTEDAGDRLRQSGVSAEKIFFVGNTMIDTLIHNEMNFVQPNFVGIGDLAKSDFILCTLHRPSNVDHGEKLIKLVQQISNASRSLPIIFPAHPRTISRLNELGKLPVNIHKVVPQSYFNFMWLLRNCAVVITDSGGVTEEATYFGVPCITLRDTTERPETVTQGTNILVGDNMELLRSYMCKALKGEWHSHTVPDRWDGLSGQRIIKVLNDLCSP